MGDISKGVVDTIQPAKKIYKIQNHLRPFFRPESIHTCQQQLNPSGDPVPFEVPQINLNLDLLFRAPRKEIIIRMPRFVKVHSLQNIYHQSIFSLIFILCYTNLITLRFFINWTFDNHSQTFFYLTFIVQGWLAKLRGLYG